MFFYGIIVVCRLMESNVHQSMAHFGLPDLQPEDSSGDNTWILEYLKRLKKHEIQTFHQIWWVHSHSASLTHPLHVHLARTAAGCPKLQQLSPNDPWNGLNRKN